MKATIINESNFENEVLCLPTILYYSDGEVRIGTTNKEAILSQVKPIMNSQRGSGLVPLGKD